MGRKERDRERGQKREREYERQVYRVEIGRTCNCRRSKKWTVNFCYRTAYRLGVSDQDYIE